MATPREHRLGEDFEPLRKQDIEDLRAMLSHEYQPGQRGRWLRRESMDKGRILNCSQRKRLRSCVQSSDSRIPTRSSRTTRAMATPREHGQGKDPEPLTKQEIEELRAKLSPELQEEEWYTILAAGTTSAHAGAEAVPLIYEIASEAVNGPAGKEADEKAVRIQRRIKESLVKGSVLFGIPCALDSVFALLPLIRAEAAQHPSRTDSGFFQRQGQTLEGVLSRGTNQLRKVYRHNWEQIRDEKMSDDMDDLRFLTLDINYGWNLSEDGVLDFKSTEMVVLAALIPQNARSQTLWHLRGCKRAGWSDECISSVRAVCMQLAQRLGCRTSKVPDLERVREDSNE